MKEMEEMYIVVEIAGYGDEGASLYPFKEYEKAKEFIRLSYENLLNESDEDDLDEDLTYFSCDDRYHSVEAMVGGYDTERTYWEITQFREPKINGKPFK